MKAKYLSLLVLLAVSSLICRLSSYLNLSSKIKIFYLHFT